MLEWDKITCTKTSPTSFSSPKEQTQFFGDFLCFRRILKAFDARAKEQETFSVIAPFMTCPSTLSETVHFFSKLQFSINLRTCSAVCSACTITLRIFNFVKCASLTTRKSFRVGKTYEKCDMQIEGEYLHAGTCTSRSFQAITCTMYIPDFCIPTSRHFLYRQP